MAALPARSLAVAALATALGVAVPPAVRAQDAPPDTTRIEVPRPVTTVPLPTGRGVFYYRAGPPGSVTIRSRSGRRADTSAAAPPSVSRAPLASGRRAPAGAPEPSVSRLDLLLLEQSILDAIDRRLAALDAARPSRDPRAPLVPPAPGAVVVVPPAAVAPAPSPPESPPPAAPPPPDRLPSPAAPPPGPPVPGEVTVETVERAILETGLFRTTAVHFEFDRATLLPLSEQTLDVVGAVLRDYPALRFEVGGHTDAIGSEEYNDALSQRRAEAVLEALVARGVGRARLSAVGYGERLPVASNANDTGRALNRRVEFLVLNPDDAARPPTPADDASGSLRDLIREEIERARERDG